MPYVRTVRTSSGSTAVQIVYSSHRGSRQIEHIGDAGAGVDAAAASDAADAADGLSGSADDPAAAGQRALSPVTFTTPPDS